MTEVNKKEPLPGKETASSYPILPLERRNTITHHARFPDYLITAEYSRQLKRSVWLLLLFIRHCDWNTGIWRGTEGKLADELGISDRTIRTWLRQLANLGVTWKRYPNSIEVRLPDALIPNSKTGKLARSDRKKQYKGSENATQVIGKTTASLTDMKTSLANHFAVPR